FGPSGKQLMLRIEEAVDKSLDRDKRAWRRMTEQTRQHAVLKLDPSGNKIGYRDVFRDYSKLTILPGDVLATLRGSTEFESRRQIAKISKPLDRLEWGMTPPTVNAYYSAARNEIVFPAGILQPPFFDKKMDEDVNFGGIGAVIGHELTHGFDDQGR